MCGIAGFSSFLDENQSVATLKKMLTRIQHRGPDESGIYINKQMALGSVRLSIIDLNSGTMPLSNADNSLWIVFNGEIFNYIELKEELLNKNHTFKTTTDTEVIVHLYEEYGSDFVSKLNGQFAIAIWDKNKQELFLARDRVGIRPLFYTELDNSFIFASEIKALAEFPGVALKISPKNLSQYFTFWTALSPATAFENIYEVPPGTTMTLGKNGKKFNTYWELPIYKPEEYSKNGLKEAINEFELLFSDAVKLRLRADVKVVAYLSGGLDSSITTSYIKNILPDNLETFSIGFTEKDFDESSFQQIAAKYFNTEHSSITCSSDEIAQSFKDVIWFAEAPLLRTSPAPMRMLAKSVHDQNIKVVITGEGADELLGGYNIFKETKIRHFWAKDSQSKYRPLLLKKLYPYLPQMNHAGNTMLKMFFGYKLNETASPIYSHLLRWHNTSRITNYFSEAYKTEIGDYNPIDEIERKLEEKLYGYDYLTKAQYIELNLFMSGYLLSSQGDRMAMANSVEGRYPFLDHRIIEFCMKLPPDLKLNGLNEKYLLKKMMQGKLPDAILNRPKQAYRAPIKSAFVSENLPEYIMEMLAEEKIVEAGIFNPKHVQQLLLKMKTKDLVSEMDSMALTGILSTQILHDLFVKKSRPELTDNDLISCHKIIIDH